jgi:DNA repair protein RadD
VVALRPYQEVCVAELRGAFAAGLRAPILQLPTGGGKTIIFAEVTRGARAKGRRVLVLVHRRELIRQAAAKLEWAGVPHGIIAGGFPQDRAEPVQIASVHTLVRRLDTLGPLDLIVIDEAHHARAETWRRVLEAQPQARLLGVTATPARLDGKGLGIEAGGMFDAIVRGPSVADLVAGGYLSPARCFVPARRLDLSGVRVRRGDYLASDLSDVVDRADVAGDAVEQYRLRADHLPAIAFCITVAHARRVAAAFQAAGYRAATIHGDLDTPSRDRLIAGLGNGGIEVLTSCEVVSEGLDVPAVAAVILLRPTKSLVLFMQQVGRGMRPAPDKDALIVNDHAGNVLAHGLPGEARDWSLAGVNKRAGGAMEVSEDGEIRQPRPIVEVADDLAEITPERLAAVRAMSYRQVIAGRLCEAELREYARARGYRPGWVWHRLREKAEAAP